MKPEKVKSRWRRNSELETGDKSSVSDVDGDKAMTAKTKMVVDTKKDSANDTKVIDSNGEVKVKMPVYDYLEENVYLFERKRSKGRKEARRMLCDCSLTEEMRQEGKLGCQDECLNRLLMIECGSRCSCKEACSNKRFQKRLYAKVEPFKTDKKGWGLKLLEDVPIGNFVIEYVGEVISTQEFKQRVKQYAREKSNHYYFMALKSDEILDATNKGNLSRFMNHSCDPNCVTQKWTVNGELRIGFFAKRDLKAGEELTFDYQFQRYGREAQKCHCGTEICSGYIGVSNEISVDVSIKSNKRKKNEEKKLENQEDLILEEEIEKLSENGGLRNKEETLLLARLMVRAEDLSSREKLLDILLRTTENILRLFLDYHGLSLLWSWMVDSDEPNFKNKILQVLSSLPVPNKTMLLESKVYSIVERWASVHCKLLPSEVTEQSFNCDKKFKKSCDTSDSDTPITSENEENSLMNGNSENACRSDEESRDLPEEVNPKSSSEISVFANKLLSSWKELKEDFRIPRREQPKSHFKGHSHNNSRRQRRMCWSCQDSGESFCKHYSRWNHSTERNRDSWNSRSRNNSIHCEDHNRKVLLPTPEGLSVENLKYSPIGSQTFTKEERRERVIIPIHESGTMANHKYSPNNSQFSSKEERRERALLPTPEVAPVDNHKYPPNSHVLTKEERREQFARSVQLEEQKKKALLEQQYGNGLIIENNCNNYNYNGNSEYNLTNDNGNYALSVNSNNYSFTELQNGHTYNSYYYSTDASHPNQPQYLPNSITNDSVNVNITLTPENANTYQQDALYQTSHSQVPFVGTPLPVISHQASVMLPDSNHLTAPITGIGTLNSSPHVPASLPVLNQEITAPSNTVIHPSLYSSEQIPGQENYSTSFSTHYHEHYPVSEHNNILYSQSQYPQVLPAQVVIDPTQSYLEVNGEAKSIVPTTLPPNWKTATDSEGNVYYYHVLTRQTQWDPPEREMLDTVDDPDEDTPTYDEPKEHKQTLRKKSHKKHPKKRSTTTAAADTSSVQVTHEVAKKIKELFRTKMSTYVVSILNPYHRDDCRVGKITSNEDFKHLARKLTHFVMAKELKHCKNVEDLDCNDNVKIKARDFIHKYMSKFGPLYKKEKYESLFV
ncbi:histone-lysine N-methyltransferase SETD2 isoform X2 [Parasteatoda tepidariorum]|nr:histone-lysine N-methyltransferase SETD2 isoform X2 [Parasteatoda tepidariorum]